MRESTYTTAVNRLVKAAGCHAQKFSDRFNAGVPDCWYSGPKADLWVEYKWVKEFPKRSPVRPKLSKLQALWLEARTQEGRQTAVIVASPAGAIIYSAGAWGNPKPASVLASRHDVAAWITGAIS